MFILLYLLIFIASYFFITALITVPNKSMAKIIYSYNDKDKSRRQIVISLDIFFTRTSKQVLKYIKLNEIRRDRLEKALLLSNSSQTPEEFVAYVVTTCSVFALVGLLFLPFKPFFTIVFIALAVFYYYYSERQLFKQVQSTVAVIEAELPRFVANINQSLSTNKNALSILERYKTENEQFLYELNKTIADIKTSSFEAAMIRWENRVNSEYLTMCTNGLKGVYNGDDVKFYFKMLETDFDKKEISTLKKGIQKMPEKMRSSMFLLYSAIALVLMTPILMMLISYIKEFFSK